ncbi:Fe-S cluster assembly protein SufD [Millisia brevis]|uniref:Fe-S cluster assembly protein SufD n=1 Tax=Millisia brevis TaxID=264148 RepID=UPI0008340C4F|nr:Fe-S cluster assembly protein SufD [Millisia brevis]
MAAGETGVVGAVAGENVKAGAVDLGANKGEVFASFDVDAFEVPTSRDEAWRFTPLRRLRGLHDGTAVADGQLSVAVAGDGVTVETVGRDDARLGTAGAPTDRVAAAAYSGFTQASVIGVPADVELAEPITVTVTGPGVDHTAFGHTHVAFGTHSSGTIVFDQVGSGAIAENLEVVVGDGARATIVLVQGWEQDTVHVAAHRIRVGRDATVRYISVSLGGELVRLSPTVIYDGPGGDAELSGLYFADDGQHLEQRLLVDHEAPNCRSRILYKGALQGDPQSDLPDAHTVWIGDVVIRASAEGTDTFELNRNLVLTDGARADSVPNLEIETGEIVGAGHASATGRFDDEQLFYLAARGIPEDVARRLVVRGFFQEILQKIPAESVRSRLEDAIEIELALTGS